MVRTEGYCNGVHLACRFKVLPYEENIGGEVEDLMEDHYKTLPEFKLLAMVPSQRAEALWENAQFPGHFDSQQHYAIAPLFASKWLMKECDGPMHE